jgi:hypothetical protein
VHRPLADADLVADLVSLIGDQVADVIAEQLAAVGADPAPAVPWGHGVVGMVRSAADNWIARPAGTSREQLADHLTALAWAGLSGVVAGTEEETP